MVTMLDAIAAKVGNIPQDTAMVAGYVDGDFAWSPADWARFPFAVAVTITVMGGDADVADVETGDMTPADAPLWASRMRAIGRIPVVYCSLSNWDTVKGEFAARGMVQPLWWIAAYDGDPSVPAGAVAHQWTDNPPANPYDTSSVGPGWPGIIKEEEMLLIFEATVVAGQYKGVAAQFVSNGMFYRWIEGANPQYNQLADIGGVGAIFNRGPVTTWPGGPVADLGAFGLPADAVTAAMLGLPFGSSAQALTISLTGTATP